MGDKPRLLVVTPQGFEELALGDELKIGRAYSCGLRLEGDGVSREHASIVRQRDRYVVRDLHSRNGVEVNGRRVDRHELEPNDVVMVGSHFLIFEPNEHIDLDAALERACALMDKSAPQAGPPTREFRPSNEAFVVENVTEQIERAVLAFLDREDDPDAAVGEEKRRVELRRAVEPFHKALYLAHVAAARFPRFDDAPALCKMAARALLDSLGGDKALIMLRAGGSEDDELEVGALVVRGEPRASLITPAAMRIVLDERRALVSGDVTRDGRLDEDARLLEAEGVVSLVGAPLMHDGDVFGLIYLDSRAGHHRYSTADLKLLLVLGEHLALHLSRVL